MQESTRSGDDSIWHNNIVPDDGNSSNRKSDESCDENQEETVSAAFDLSVLEAEVSLQEATLETLSVQLRTLEELLQTEKLAYEQNVGQLNTLRSREAKLQQSVLDNTELVKSVENTLLKTLEALKRKMTSLTKTTPPPPTTSTPTITTSLQSDAKTENVPLNYDDFEDDDVDNSADGILSEMMGLGDNDEQYSVGEKTITEEAHETNHFEADITSKGMEEDEQSIPDDNLTVLAPETDSITATESINSMAMERAKRNPVRTMNSYMENRCWSGSLFSNYIFQNPKLLFKVLSIQSNEIQCLAAFPSPHSTAPTNAEHHNISTQTVQNPQKQLQQLSTSPIATTKRGKTFYHQFTHSTCLDPISLLFHWHSPGYRYTLPWEHDENTALVSLSNYHDAASNEDDTTCTNNHKLISSLQPVKAESETPQLDPTRILCPYDLTGKCLDHTCPFQHLTSNSSPCEPTRSQGVLHGDLVSLNIPDELRFVPLPDLKPYNVLLCESLPSIGEKVTAAVDGKEKRVRKKRRYETVGKVVSTTNPDEIESDDFVSLPRISFMGNISDDGSSIGEPDSTDMIQFIKTSDDTNKIAKKEISNSTHAFDLSSDALPWWWPSTSSLKELSSAESRTTQSNARNAFPLPLLDDAIPIISNELYSLKLKPSEGGETRHDNWIKVLAGVVDLLRLSFSAGRVAEVAPILSSFLAVKRSRGIEVSHPFNLCLTHVRSIVDHFLLQPSYSSTVCDIFHIQQKLFFISEWLFAYHTKNKNEKNFAMDLLWSNSLESLLTEAIEVTSDNRLPYSILHLQVQSMIGDLFSNSDYKEDEIKWLSMLSRCKELGYKIARLTLCVESPYIIPDFLEYLWLRIDERKEYLQSLSREQSFACIMTCLIPSLFSGVAMLSLEDVQRNKISSIDKQEYRLFAALRSVDSCIQGIIYRILALHERKTTSCLERHMFEGLLLAPVVALSASIAVELGLHSKAQRRIEHAFQQNEHTLGPATAEGLVFSSLLWSQLCMLRSCFSSTPISEEVQDSSVACLTHGLKHYGVCPSYVSLTGDSSLIRSSGSFCRNWDFLHRFSAKQERNDMLNVSLNAPYFSSLDGKLPYSILLFQNILSTLHVKMCSIEFLPETFGHNLCQLLFLDLSCNKLCRLPNSICSISTLKHLNVSQNRLVSLPMDIGLIRDLEVLNISHNDIKVLPASLVNCTKIQVLDLQGNVQLHTIPHDLSLRLKKLHTLLL